MNGRERESERRKMAEETPKKPKKKYDYEQIVIIFFSKEYDYEPIVTIFFEPGWGCGWGWSVRPSQKKESH